jgi:hypothetical protein
MEFNKRFYSIEFRNICLPPTAAFCIKVVTLLNFKEIGKSTMYICMFRRIKKFQISRTIWDVASERAWREVMESRARIMHYQSQLADLVDVLAVDFDIVDRLRDSRKRNGQNDRKSIETLEPLALG